MDDVPLPDQTDREVMRQAVYGRGRAKTAAREELAYRGLLYRVCGAPEGGCGAGARRRVLTRDESCTMCGSEMRITKNQTPPKGDD
jgi:hypothetical protein